MVASSNLKGRTADIEVFRTLLRQISGDD